MIIIMIIICGSWRIKSVSCVIINSDWHSFEHDRFDKLGVCNRRQVVRVLCRIFF